MGALLVCFTASADAPKRLADKEPGNCAACHAGGPVPFSRP
jgi:hypothetical protein